METLVSFLKVFLTGGIICSIGQILIDKTKLTPARILVTFVVIGVLLTGIGVYPYIVEFGGAGATVPLTGFGYSLAKGVINEIDKIGILGAFTGGIKATAGGVAAAIFFSLISAMVFSPKAK